MRIIPLPGETQRALGFTHKAIINYSDLTAAATTQTIQLHPNLTPADEQNANPTTDYLPLGVCLGPVAINLVTPFTGGSISAMTVAIGDPSSNNRYLSAADVFTALATNTAATKIGTVFYTYNTSDVGNNYGALQILFTSTSDNVKSATAGQLEVYFTRRDLYRLTQVGQP